ncbi:MAG TPA: tetratricopeptide repeat protein [Xanthobacteraceae bacterium]|nr:tetratricopeptide repeat protein [Xanthobacteraceae bacterium]
MMSKQAGKSKGARAVTTAEAEALARAVAAADSGNLSEAEGIARDILARSPQHSGALQLLGAMLMAQKRPRDAVAPLEEAARRSANPQLETHVAIALCETGRTDEALTWLYRAVERQPVYARAFQELGNLLRTKRRYVEAEAVLKRGVEAAPTVAELSLVLGGVCLDRADSPGAKIAFARALSMVPGNADALVGFGVALQYEGDFARAAERFRRVLAHDPGHHRARMNLGYCLIELGQVDDGIACLRAAVETAPHNYGSALRMLISAGRGRFWLKRSAAAEHLGAKGSRS